MLKNMAPLTKEEQDFAAEHHDIVIKYLRLCGLKVDEWYDVVIFRFLWSVRRWFTEPHLHKYNFEIIAFYAMRSAIGNERRKQRRRAKYEAAFSLDEVISGTEGCTYLEVFADPHDPYRVIDERETIKEQLSIISPQQRAVIYAEVVGYGIARGC